LTVFIRGFNHRSFKREKAGKLSLSGLNNAQYQIAMSDANWSASQVNKSSPTLDGPALICFLIRSYPCQKPFFLFHYLSKRIFDTEEADDTADNGGSINNNEFIYLETIRGYLCQRSFLYHQCFIPEGQSIKMGATRGSGL